MRAITQLPSASCAQAPSRPEGHARTTRVGGAKRRALHVAEHSSKLCCVMAGGLPLERWRCREAPDDAESRVPDAMMT